MSAGRPTMSDDELTKAIAEAEAAHDHDRFWELVDEQVLREAERSEPTA